MTVRHLVRRLAALPAPAMREAVLREAIEAMPPEQAAPLLEEALVRGRRAGPPYDVALTALAGLLDADALHYDVRAALYAEARAGSHAILAGMLRSARERTGPEAAIERQLRPGARALTLGERKALARGPRGDMMERLLRDPNPHVIRNLLENPRLIEKDVVFIAALRPQSPDNLRCVFRSRRWSSRYAVRRALIWNPHTPGEIAVRLLPFLVEEDLRALARDGPAPEVCREARTLLEARARRGSSAE